MSSTARLRLTNDLKRFQTEDAALLNVYAMPKENNFLMWEAVIFGAEDTIWQGACLKLLLEFNEEYPNKPPQVRFVTPIFHPNVYADGRICLDILTNNWTPIYDTYSVLASIQLLLSNPNPDSPANSEAAKLYTENKTEYAKRVKDVVEGSWRA